MTSEWTGDVPNLALLNQMVMEALPLSLHAGPVEQMFQRDTLRLLRIA